MGMSIMNMLENIHGYTCILRTGFNEGILVECLLLVGVQYS